MRLSFEYKGTKISYELMYKKSTAISIKITPEGTVSVTAPIGTTVQTVMDKVKGNAPWIIDELGNLEVKTHKNKISKQYTYLGKNYGVEIIKNENAAAINVKLARGKFIIEAPIEDTEKIKKALLTWYKNKVVTKIKERLNLYNNLFKKTPKEINAEGDENILFKATKDGFFVSAAAGMLPVKVMDYMIISGLCALNNLDEKESNQKMKEILPDYEESKKWLEDNKQNLLL